MRDAWVAAEMVLLTRDVQTSTRGIRPCFQPAGRRSLRLVAFTRIKVLSCRLIMTRKEGGRAASLVNCTGKKINHAKSAKIKFRTNPFKVPERLRDH